MLHLIEFIPGTQEIKPIIYKTFEDGFIVRQMLPEDTKTVQKWFADLNVATVSR